MGGLEWLLWVVGALIVLSGLVVAGRAVLFDSGRKTRWR